MTQNPLQQSYFHGIRMLRLCGGAIMVIAAIATYWGAVHTTAGQRTDQRWMTRVSEASATGYQAAESITRLQIPIIVIGIAATVALTAANRRPLVSLLRAASIIAAPTAAAFVGKGVLDRPALDGLVMHNSFPSGTVASVSATAAALVLTTPRGWRLVVGAPAAVVVSAMSVSVIVLKWHRPSDVIGALLLAAAATLIVSASRNPDRRATGVVDVLGDPGNERLISRRVTANPAAPRVRATSPRSM